MHKIIKLTDTHYIGVDDSEIKEGDWIVAIYDCNYYVIQAQNLCIGDTEHGKQLMTSGNGTHEIRFCKKNRTLLKI